MNTELESDAAAVIVEAPEATSVVDKAIATEKTNAALKVTAVTVDALEVKFKETSTVEPLSVNTAVADDVVAGVKDTVSLSVRVGTTSVEVKFNASIPEADQLNFDAAAAEVGLGGGANDEFKSSAVAAQHPTSDVGSVGDVAAVDATAIAADAAGDKPTASKY